MKPVNPRQGALEILLRVEGGAYADLALDGYLDRNASIDPRDRALLTELVYGTLRHQGRVDYALSRFCRQPLVKTEPAVRALLRLGAYQILQLDRIPDRAAVNETVELARRQGLSRATGFLNAVLRSLSRERDSLKWPDPAADPVDHLTHTLSLPEWLARQWLSEMGPGEAFGLAQAMLEPAPFTLRVNTLRSDRDRFLEALDASGASGRPTLYAPEGVVPEGQGAELPGRDQGWYQVQDEASMLIAHLLGPAAGERILDACAAPGGKTTHLAALTGNQASVTAVDLHPQRLHLVEQGARRLGCRGIETIPFDLTEIPTMLARESFDRVLVDAPCSGLGVLRRNPESRWRRCAEDVRELARLQGTILAHVAPLVRSGGVLLYSVCTPTLAETTGVVDAFLADHPDFAAEDLRPLFPAWAELFDERGRLRTFPHRHGGMDAFFAVRLKKG